MKELRLPLTKDETVKLHAGESVLLTGTIVTATARTNASKSTLRTGTPCLSKSKAHIFTMRGLARLNPTRLQVAADLPRRHVWTFTLLNFCITD